MLVESSKDLINASFGLLDNKVDIQSIEVSDNLVLRIKIDDDDWSDSTKLDYKIASIILNFQRDIIGFYNDIFNENVSLSTIDKFPFLIVKIEIKDGCIEIFAFLKEFVNKILHDMDSKDKITVLLIILGIITAGGAAWVGIEYFSYLKETKIAEVSSKNRNRAIEALEKSNLALIENQKTPKYLANNVKNGTIKIGDERPLTSKEIKKISKQKDNTAEKSCNIDNTYLITKYDFKEHAACLDDGIHSFWSSTEYLDDVSREKLKTIADEAITTKVVQSAPLQVTATIKDGTVKHAAIIGIGEKRPSTISLSDIVTTTTLPEDKPMTSRCSLFDNIQAEANEPNAGKNERRE